MTTYPFSEPHRLFCFGKSALVDGGRQSASKTPFATPWEFLERAVWTRDEASMKIRQFPAALEHNGERRFEYLHELTDHWLDYKVTAYEKSRRMMITWWLVALYLYSVMTDNTDTSAVASDKLEKSAYLLGQDRMQFIYDHIPPVDERMAEILRLQGYDPTPFREQVWPIKPLVEFKGKRGRGWELAECQQTGSSIMAMASGEKQMQQYTFRKILADEFSRWERQEESLRNMQPTIQGGGHIHLVCTPELGSFAYDVLYDRGGK